MRKFFVALCILTLLAMIGWKLSEGWRKSRADNIRLISTSDAANIKENITIAGDDWLGYLVFRSRYFQKELEKKQIGVRFVMEPDFKARFDKLASGEFDIACATIDSYLVNGLSSKYPGVIVFGIDESFGGDALIVRDGISSLDDLKSPGITGAFVGYSPSEFLLKSQISHFGIESLLPQIDKFRTADASSAYQKFKSGNVDFAVLWEPFASRALAEVPGSSRLIDTRQARGIIIDVAVASRKIVAEKPKLVQEVTEAYFVALHHFLQEPENFKEQARVDTGEPRANAEAMLSGVRFFNAAENHAIATGKSSFDMSDTIISITDVLIDVGDLKVDPLKGNPRLILNSNFAEIAAKNPILKSSTASNSGNAQAFFRPLPPESWEKLSQNLTGTLLEKPITFGSGQSTIPEEFQDELCVAAEKLIHYPEHRVIVQAHVSPGSDPVIDKSLSLERAAAIRQFLIDNCKISSARIYGQGVGGDQPVARKSGESMRAWKRRCRRARIFIAEDK